MTAKTREPGFTQRNDAPASRSRAAADASPRLQALAEQLSVAFSTTNDDFLAVLFRQLARASLQGRDLDEDDLGFMVSAVAGIKPRDQLEMMLTAQMAAVHIATMTSAQRLRSADNIQQQDSAERAFNKLARTFATQMEAFTRYRTGGDQQVVQHVSVSDGGQAIVGNVTQAPREIAVNGAASGS